MSNDARRNVRVLILSVLAVLVVVIVRPIEARDKAPELPADRLAALDRITSDSLKGHLSFLASDLLEGRDTPSKGLDLAAEYIAAQFRRAGLEPVGDDGYFQTANWELSEPDPASYKFEIVAGGETISVPLDEVTSPRLSSLDLPATASYKIGPKAGDELDVEKIAGKVVFLEIPANAGMGTPEQAQIRALLTKIGQSKAAAVVSISKRPRSNVRLAPRVGAAAAAAASGQLVDPKNPVGVGGRSIGAPTLTVFDPKVVQFFDQMPEGASNVMVTVHGGSNRRPVKLRNVVGLIRGSDPALKETCVMVTSHYDHIGVRGAEGTDRIFNGANDDGSGTVSVVEIASALATLKDRPKRSILFVTFFGEEKGLLGSRYYGRNPLFPIEKTVADVNLEQVGRTDDNEGPQVLRASLTGFGYSGVSTAFVNAGEAEGSRSSSIPGTATPSSAGATTRRSPTSASPRTRSASPSPIPTTTARPTTGTRSTTSTWPGSTGWSPEPS